MSSSAFSIRLIALGFLAVPMLLRGQLPTTVAPAEWAPEVIRPIFELGHTYRFVTRTELRTQLPQAGLCEASFEQQVRLDTKVRVDGKKGIVLRARTEKLGVQFGSPVGSLNFDSMDPEDQNSPVARHFQASLNREVDLTLNENLRIFGAEESGRGLEEAAIPGMPRFGPDELQQLVATLSQGFTGDVVKPGDAWVLQGAREVGGAGLVEFDLTYRHRGIANFEGNNCISIEFTGRMSGGIPSSLADESGAGANPIDLKGDDIRGRILFDPLDRMVRHIEQSIRLRLVVPGAEGALPEEIPVDQLTTIRLLHIVPTP